MVEKNGNSHGQIEAIFRNCERIKARELRRAAKIIAAKRDTREYNQP
ncbi:MAG: hypothetical protein ACM3JQ_05960 [Candidatus Eiseniibacteriota bacterium]